MSWEIGLMLVIVGLALIAATAAGVHFEEKDRK